MRASRRKAASVFVSYAHEDEQLRDKLFNDVSGLHSGGYISASSDGQIVPGQEWADAIIRRLDEGDVIVLLVTLASSARST